jgi:hypothetical protein
MHTVLFFSRFLLILNLHVLKLVPFRRHGADQVEC